MLIHTHVYYSNRFEPGTLFPDTFRLDRGKLLQVEPATLVKVKPVYREVPLESTKSPKSGPISRPTTEYSIGTTLMYVVNQDTACNVLSGISEIGCRSFEHKSTQFTGSIGTSAGFASWRHIDKSVHCGIGTSARFASWAHIDKSIHCGIGYPDSVMSFALAVEPLEARVSSTNADFKYANIVGDVEVEASLSCSAESTPMFPSSISITVI